MLENWEFVVSLNGLVSVDWVERGSGHSVDEEGTDAEPEDHEDPVQHVGEIVGWFGVGVLEVGMLSPEQSSENDQWEHETDEEDEEQGFDQVVDLAHHGGFAFDDLHGKPGEDQDQKDALFDEGNVHEHESSSSFGDVVKDLDLGWESPAQVVHVHIIEEFSEMDGHVMSGSLGDKFSSTVNKGTEAEGEDDVSGGVDEVEGLTGHSTDNVDDEEEHTDEFDDSPDEAENLGKFEWVLGVVHVWWSWGTMERVFESEGGLGEGLTGQQGDERKCAEVVLCHLFFFLILKLLLS